MNIISIHTAKLKNAITKEAMAHPGNTLEPPGEFLDYVHAVQENYFHMDIIQSMEDQCCLLQLASIVRNGSKKN